VVDRRERTSEELEKLFEEQLRFLESSAEAYDNGFTGEAKRIATSIRVLLHDTNTSKSLLFQLRKKDKLFLDTAYDKNPKSIISYSGLVSLAIINGKSKYVALLDEIPPPSRNQWLDFETWWAKSIFANQKNEEISRKTIILTAVNQDGGAHVDSKIDLLYDKLVSGNYMGWKHASSNSESFIGGAESAAIRQIAHEILKTLKPRYYKKPEMKDMTVFSNPFVVVDQPTSQRLHDKKKIGRNDLCSCGSGRKFKKCCGR